MNLGYEESSLSVCYALSIDEWLPKFRRNVPTSWGSGSPRNPLGLFDTEYRGTILFDTSVYFTQIHSLTPQNIWIVSNPAATTSNFARSDKLAVNSSGPTSGILFRTSSMLLCIATVISATLQTARWIKSQRLPSTPISVTKEVFKLT